MGFLADLTMVQRAAGAAILVLLLVLLLVKQRQGKAAHAGGAADKAPKATSKRQPKAKATTSKGEKSKRGRSFGRAKKDASEELSEPVAESKGSQGRMVPRLPAAGSEEPAMLEPVEAFADAEPAAVVPVVADENGMINEPGWPTPGEVWAAPDAGFGASETETWAAPDPDDDPLSALTTEEPAEFDMSAGWEDEEPAAATAESTEDEVQSWDAAQEDFDWTAGDADEAWSAPVEEEPEAAEETDSWAGADEDAVWSEPDETATTGSWDASEESETVTEESPVAVAVEEPEPVEETETSALVWEPVDEVEALEEPAEPVVADADVPAPIGEWTPVEESMDAQPIEAAVPDAGYAPEPVAADEPAPAMAEAEVELAPAALVMEPPVRETAPEPMFTLPSIGLDEPVESHVEEEPADLPMEPAPVAFSPAVAEPVDHDDHVVAADADPDFNPADRWAAMSPGGVTEVTDPVASWARLQPVVPAVIVAAPVRGAAPALPVMESPATAPGVAWWDVPSGVEVDPRRGRFALGGYAIQAGHQVVSGVTFREGVVPPPTHWVIGPVVGEVAPGTLVLNVDGCLNCRPEDLAVLTDPGFAPTTDGFSLKLVATETGPFAASGTFFIS